MQPGTTRAAKNVQSVSMLVLDCDRGESIEVLEALDRAEALWMDALEKLELAEA